MGGDGEVRSEPGSSVTALKNQVGIYPMLPKATAKVGVVSELSRFKVVEGMPGDADSGSVYEGGDRGGGNCFQVLHLLQSWCRRATSF